LNNWFKERKDLFIKELVEEYFESKFFFNQILMDYKNNGKIQFAKMDQWVGSETKKGVLWNLKDASHNLFRNQNSTLDLAEYIFDWTVGSIFHEVMKLKEDVYQLEAYILDEAKIRETGKDAELKMIMEEYHIITENAQKTLKSEIESVQYLFSKSNALLKCLLSRYSNNGLLLRFLLKNHRRIHELLEGESLPNILKLMYGEKWDKAFVLAAKSYLDGGWLEEAKGVLEMGIDLFPNSQEIEDSLVRTQLGRMSKS
jgi:hypothetical protein